MSFIAASGMPRNVVAAMPSAGGWLVDARRATVWGVGAMLYRFRSRKLHKPSVPQPISGQGAKLISRALRPEHLREAILAAEAPKGSGAQGVMVTVS